MDLYEGIKGINMGVYYKITKINKLYRFSACQLTRNLVY